MSLRFRYSDPRGIDEPAVMVSLGSNVRFGEMHLPNAAEAGETATGGIQIDDPGGLYSFAAYRAFDVAETSAPSNNQIIGRYVIGDRTVGRSKERSMLTGADRLWDIDLYDYNWHLGKRILVDADSNRPEETAGDRLRWLLTRAAHINLHDYGHVTYPTHQVDAADFRGQRATDVLADCALEGGYNFWIDVNEAHGTPELFFMDTDVADVSTLFISNDIFDVDNVTTFFPYRDGKLLRSGSRLAFGVKLDYGDSRYVYVRNDVVGEQFAKVDQQSTRFNVKREARARRIATKFLNDHATEGDRISVGIKVPLALVNSVRHGQVINVRFLHLPGFETWTKMFVLRRFVGQEPEGGAEYYKIDLELVPTYPLGNGTAPVTTGTAGAIAYAPTRATAGAGNEFPIKFRSTGDDPGVGLPLYPRDAAHFNYVGAVPNVTGLVVLAASGILDVRLNFSFLDVGPHGFTAQLMLNGGPIAEGGATSPTAHTFDLYAYNVAVVAGDTFTARLLSDSPSNPSIPAGIGSGEERLQILATSRVSS